LDIGKARQSAASMEGLGRIVRIEEGSSVVTSSPVRAWNDLQRILLGDCFEADPCIAQMFAAPGQIRGVLMPGRARDPSAGLEEHFLGEVPDMLGAPEVGEQLAKGKGSHQLVQPGLRERVGVVVVRLLLGPIEYAKGVGTMVLDGPVEGRPTPSQLLLTENAFDENGPVI